MIKWFKEVVSCKVYVCGRWHKQGRAYNEAQVYQSNVLVLKKSSMFTGVCFNSTV